MKGGKKRGKTEFLKGRLKTPITERLARVNEANESLRFLRSDWLKRLLSLMMSHVFQERC